MNTNPHYINSNSNAILIVVATLMGAGFVASGLLYKDNQAKSTQLNNASNMVVLLYQQAHQTVATKDRFIADLVSYTSQFATNDKVSELAVATTRAWIFNTNVPHRQEFEAQVTATNVILRKKPYETNSAATP